MMKRRQFSTLLCLASMGATAQAASFPDRPIRLICPFPAGNTVDTMTRRLAEALGKELNQSVFVENRGGAAGVIGAKTLADAHADGYTIGITTNGTHSATGTLSSKFPYDEKKNFTHIGLLSTLPWVMMTSANMPAENLRELVSLAKKAPDTVSGYHLSGSTQLLVLLLEKLAGIEILDVPYVSHTQAMIDLRSGLVQVGWVSTSTAISEQKNGAYRLLGVSTAERLPSLPQVSPIADLLPGFVFSSWLGLGAPKGIPPDRIETIRKALSNVLASAEFQEVIRNLGAVPGGPARESDILSLIDNENRLVAQLFENKASKQ